MSLYLEVPGTSVCACVFGCKRKILIAFRQTTCLTMQTLIPPLHTHFLLVLQAISVNTKCAMFSIHIYKRFRYSNTSIFIFETMTFSWISAIKMCATIEMEWILIWFLFSFMFGFFFILSNEFVKHLRSMPRFFQTVLLNRILYIYDTILIVIEMHVLIMPFNLS